MIRLYGAARTRAARCLWMLEEIGVPFEHIDFEGVDEAQRLETVRPVNPIGKIPALEDGDVRLFESMAINLYLAREYGGELWPEDPALQARAVSWSIWGMTEMEPPLAQLFFERALKKPEDHDPENDARAVASLKRPLDALESELSGSAWLLGDHFGVADLNLASVMALTLRAGYAIDGHPHAARWLERCFERPAFHASRPSPEHS